MRSTQVWRKWEALKCVIGATSKSILTVHFYTNLPTYPIATKQPTYDLVLVEKTPLDRNPAAVYRHGQRAAASGFVIGMGENSQ